MRHLLTATVFGVTLTAGLSAPQAFANPSSNLLIASARSHPQAQRSIQAQPTGSSTQPTTNPTNGTIKQPERTQPTSTDKNTSDRNTKEVVPEYCKVDLPLVVGEDDWLYRETWYKCKYGT